MKRQIFTLGMVLALAFGTALFAQSNTGSTLPPSQQVDQSNQPEQTGHPDVDVDAGHNANNGVLNVDVKRHGDADTKAGNNPNGNRDLTGTGTTTDTTGTTTTTGTYNGTTDTSATSDTTTANGRSLPGTASDMPLLGLVGLLSLGAALALRAGR